MMLFLLLLSAVVVGGNSLNIQKGSGFNVNLADLTSKSQALAEKLTAKPVAGRRTIVFAKFLTVVAETTQTRISDQELRDLFRFLDIDGNGFISAAELKQALAAGGLNLTDEQLERIIRQADIDGDGQINYDELVILLQKSLVGK